MADVMLMLGVPEHIRSDNGAEMTAKVVHYWLTQSEPKPCSSSPAAPERMAAANPSTENYATKCSTAKSSIA